MSASSSAGGGAGGSSRGVSLAWQRTRRNGSGTAARGAAVTTRLQGAALGAACVHGAQRASAMTA